MVEISTWVRNRVSADVDLDREAMVKLACGSSARRSSGDLRAARRGNALLPAALPRPEPRRLAHLLGGRAADRLPRPRPLIRAPSACARGCSTRTGSAWRRTGGSASGRRCTRRAGHSTSTPPTSTASVAAPGRPRHVDPRVLARTLAHGALRARPARHAQDRHHVRGRAPRRGVILFASRIPLVWTPAARIPPAGTSWRRRLRRRNRLDFPTTASDSVGRLVAATSARAARRQA